MRKGLDAGLAVGLVHFLQFEGRVFVNSVLEDLDALVILREIWVVRRESDHAESLGSLQRPMDVIVFLILGLVQASGEAPVQYGLGVIKIGFYAPR